MEFLRAYIEDKIDIDESKWQAIASLFTKTTYQKGEEIYSGGVCYKLSYLSEGVARSYMLTTDGKEITLGVHYRKEDETIDPFIGDYISYLDGSESAIFCEALGDCVVYEADFSKLELFYESDIKYMKLARKISDTLLVTIAKRIRETMRYSAKEKYSFVQSLSPIYEKFLTDYQLASMIGITPQSFSRLKNT